MNETYNIPINQPGSGCGSVSWATTEPNMPDANRQQGNQQPIASMQGMTLEILRDCEEQADQILTNLQGTSASKRENAPTQNMHHATAEIVTSAKILLDKLRTINIVLFGG